MSSKDNFAAQLADAMQTKTRKQYDFDRCECELRDELPRAMIRADTTGSMKSRESRNELFDLNSILSHLGNRNPMPKPVVPGDIVWILDNVAFRPSRMGSWQAEFTIAVFENPEPSDEAIVAAINVLASVIGLSDSAKDTSTIRTRLMPFLWDLRKGRQVIALQKEKQLKLGPTGTGGVSNDLVKLPKADPATIVKSDAVVPQGVTGILQSWTYFAEPEGWSVISDIDDTIKVTLTGTPTGILQTTFVDEPQPIPGMPELYAKLKSWLPSDTPWFYLSASPYNLYPFLREFRNQHYPPGAILLRDNISWKTIAGLLRALMQQTEEYKAERLRKIHSWFPKRKMILIGDSTQSDPEAYGELYRAFPKWVKCILIREADIKAVGIEEKNTHERFQKAFKDVPRDKWFVFKQPQQCEEILNTVIKEES